MPTHEDMPWERDERRRRQDAARARPTRERSSVPVVPAVLVVLGLIIFKAIQLGESPAPPDAIPVRPAAPVTVETIVRRPIEKPRTARPRRVTWPTEFRSRWTGPATLEVWGSTAAPDGATVTIYAKRSRDGRAFRLARVPAARGHFLARARVPEPLRGVAIRVGARTG